MDTGALKLLYTNVSQIISKHSALAEATGENFNVFQILGLESAEVRTHSAFLCELLNSKGSHGQGDRYLRLFADRFSIEDFHTPSSTIEVEKYIGGITSDYENGGRIDILIKDKDNRQILIENKIYASDQEKQLLRYHRFDPHARLIYLTLNGLPPPERSTGNTLSKDHVLSLSYKDDIIGWLDACLKESVSKPLIRETITQYITLVRNLTGQIENQRMSSDIRMFIANNPELLDSMEACTKELQALKLETQALFVSKMHARFISGEIMRTDDVSIIAKWDEDSDGVHFGYQAIQHGKNISANPDLATIVATLKTIDGNFHFHDFWLGWINPEPFKYRKRFIQMASSDLVALYQDESLLNTFVDKIVLQEKIIRDRLLASIQSFKLPTQKISNSE
ncbi:MAG: PD-(D/E)XK nuclease family protein [Pseudohongiella sp.]|uniref:PD-(D/E)XK nuclease family protein n=1 Tax=Pseudohongiella sp. TaxID=1979412 RepID=UPI0034A01164